MRFAFILVWKARWPVEVQCEVLEVSRSGFPYYAWRDRPWPSEPWRTPRSWSR